MKAQVVLLCAMVGNGLSALLHQQPVSSSRAAPKQKSVMDENALEETWLSSKQKRDWDPSNPDRWITQCPWTPKGQMLSPKVASRRAAFHLFGGNYGAVSSIPMIIPGDYCAEFTFLVPASAANSTCSLMFLFPRQRDTTEYMFESFLTGADLIVDGFTDWKAREYPLGPIKHLEIRPDVQKRFNVMQGEYALVFARPCPNGDVGSDPVDMKLFGKLCSSETRLTWFQDGKPCPMGLYIFVHPKRRNDVHDSVDNYPRD